MLLDTMATRAVRFLFQCEKRNLTIVHEVPSLLINADVNAKDDPVWMETFLKVVKTIVMGHQKDGREASNDKCGICGSATVHVRRIYASYPLVLVSSLRHVICGDLLFRVGLISSISAQ